MNHNAPLTFLLNTAVYMPAQGPADSNRVGDEINTIGYKLKMVIGQKKDRPNVTFKYWVVKVPKGSTYSYNAWFKNVSNNLLLDDINKDFVKTLASAAWENC